MKKKVVILDYGSGNVKSVFNLISTLTPNVEVTNQRSKIIEATHLVLPGVGAFGTAIHKIRNTIPIDDLENEVLSKKKPFLGICVGMQVLAERGSEFGEYKGLGWIEGEVAIIDVNDKPLPHVGWNNLLFRSNHKFIQGLPENPDFYFVHSYIFRVKNTQNILATTIYGEEFCSIVQKNNILGVQFHPEKSQRVGIKLLSNFLNN